ncbi:MAG: 6-phosphogluconolactonase [Rhizobiaceae bacterium]|nr:6-phosphogluconolactonase [Rhizobiaceae bacterium]MCV0406081.1 6-phosphogluconolactonase [Rhizobiaceae bacterium]
MRRHLFDAREDLANSLARRVSETLNKGLEARGAASLAISGGSTPGRFLDALSKERIDWTKVGITLVDERFVPPSSDRSNERLARERLLHNEARLARFVPLYSAAATAEEAARAAEAGIALLPKPFDAVILGMGTDGHTASFFPDAGNLAELLDRDGRRLVLAVDAPSAGEPRLTLTLPLLVEARFLALHIEGGKKREALDAALADGGPETPIRAVADAAPRLELYWAP